MLFGSDPEWKEIQISFTTAMMTDALLIKMLPNSTKWECLV